jgi:TetR/AcrR family transcriptional regulator, cholesterol catabolism regulator
MMEITERIILEASQLFMKHGIKSITMDDIATHMGISKRTIYENFKDKEALLGSCISCNHDQQRQQRQSVLESSSNVLEAIFEIMFEVTAKMNQIHPSFMTDLRKYHFTLWEQKIVSFQEEHISDLKGLLQKGIQDKIFREDINIEIVSRMLNLQLQELSNESVFPSEQFTRAEVFVNIIVNFTRGIATPKGIKIIEKIIRERKSQSSQ